MKTIEILSWKKQRSECGARLNLIDHVQVFAYESGISFEIDESKKELSVRIEKYADEFDYSKDKKEKTGEDKTHVDKCVIIGSKEQIKEFQYFGGYNLVGLRANNDTQELCTVIENLGREISSLRFEVQELHEKLKTTRQQFISEEL